MAQGSYFQIKANGISDNLLGILTDFLKLRK